MTELLGATKAEWSHFDLALGLAANMLPCVPAAPDVRVLAGSAIEGKVGKIPSVFNSQGEAHGIPKWQTIDIAPASVAVWSADGRYNLCLRTGVGGGLYAFDVDVDDRDLAERIRATIQSELGAELPVRTRSNSGKFLIPFFLSPGTVCKKRIIKLDHDKRGKKIELLGDGQQFVAAGTHSSGVRYEWRFGLPYSIPLLIAERMDAVWQRLARDFGVEEQRTSTSSTSGECPPEILTEIDEPTWDELRSALRYLLDKVEDNESWSQIGYALLSLQRSRPAQQLWLDFSYKAVGYEEGAPERWWDTHAGQIPRSDYRHIFTLARDAGWGRSSSPDVFPVTTSAERPAVDLAPATELAGNATLAGSEGAGDILPPPPDKPIIRVTANNLPLVMRQCADLVHPELYVHAGQLSKIGAASEVADEEVTRDPDQPLIIKAISSSWLEVRMTELATWEKKTGSRGPIKNATPDTVRGKYASVNCPNDIAYKFLTLPEWPRLRALEAIVSAPFIRTDGTVCEREGYDGKSRAYLKRNADFPPLDTSCSIDDARAARDRLMYPFSEFPFATDGARSAYLAHLLTEAARLSIDTAPMFWYTAPDAGTGKSLLSDMPSLIVQGRLPPRRSWPRTEEELRKQLFASLLIGDRSMIFDNVPSGFKVRTAELCAIITSPVWADRILGASKIVTVQNRLTLVASGNNVTPAGDMSRRSVVIRLDANMEHLRERRFEIENLRGYVREHRVELLMDALTILSAYRHYRPQPREFPVPLPSFESWSERVRNAIIWLGMADPLENQDDETDNDNGAVGEAFQALGPTFLSPFTASDISRLVGANDSLNRALIDAGCAEPYESMKVGYWLRDNRDRIAGGWKLIRLKLRDGINRWQFQQQTQSNGDLV